MRSLRFIYSKRLSKCCKHRALLVRSRRGGFISQNCLKCGSSSYVGQNELPDLVCDHCESKLCVEKSDGKNYHYVCEACGREWKLADVLPDWSKLFEYSGLGVDSDHA